MQESAKTIKEKRSVPGRIIRNILFIVAIPIIILWIAIIALYIPSVQRYATDTLCREISRSSGYDVNIGSVHLAFPLKLHIGDFTVSRNDTVYIKGEEANVNISILPLMRGEVELNYISLENVDVDTKGMIPGVAIEGNIGFFRTVARNIDLNKETANIRQLFLHSTHVDIRLTDTTANEKNDKNPVEWIIMLHKGTIEECSANILLPEKGIDSGIEIGKLELKEGVVDIGNKSYKAANASISKSNVSYDITGSGTPRDHIRANGISLECRDFELTPGFAKISLEELKFTQPGGMRVTEATASIFGDHNSLEVRHMSVRSSYGSYIIAKGSIPWQALADKATGKLIADIDMNIDKRDLGALLTDREYASLALFGDTLFTSNIEMNGNMSFMNIDTINIYTPGIASLSASGYAKSLDNPGKLSATLDIKGFSDDIRRIIYGVSTGNSAGRVEAEGIVNYNSGIADASLNLKGGNGEATLNALYDINTGRYDATADVSDISPAVILPEIPIDKLSFGLKAKGNGFDLFDKSTAYYAQVSLDTLQYTGTSLGSIVLDASQENGVSTIIATGNDPNLVFSLYADNKLDSTGIKNITRLDVRKADFGKLNLVNGDLSSELQFALEFGSDLSEIHSLKFSGEKIRLVTAQRTFTPENIYVDIATAPDTTHIIAKNGDLNISGAMKSGYNRLFRSLERTGEIFNESMKQGNIVDFIKEYERVLPGVSFRFSCGRNNMLANFLAMNGITTNSMSLSATVDSVSGINIRGGVYGVKSGKINLDTLRLVTRQEDDKVRYFARVRSTAINPDNEKESYNAALFGSLADDTLATNFVFRDRKEKIGVSLGTNTRIMPGRLSIHFKPDAKLFGEMFTFNRDNYINVGKGFSVEADVEFSNANGAGMHLYTIPDSSAEYNAAIELHNADLKSITSLIPYSPDIAGLLNLNLHVRETGNSIGLSSDISAEKVVYEGVYVGNEFIEAVYFPKGNDIHYVDLRLKHEDNEIIHMSGNYDDKDDNPIFEGNIILTQFPLEISRAFMQDAGISLNGFINGEMSARGKPGKLNTNGHIQFKSVNIDAYRFGTQLHMSDETVRIEDNKLQFNNFNIYAQGNNPFRINGDIDFTIFADPTFNLRMNADNYEFINSGRKKGSMFYGRLFVDTRAMIGGTLSNMRMYGNVTMLGKSNITYVTLEAPIESDKELDGLVEFVNFKDTTTIVTRDSDIDLGNINLNLNLRIEDGARINADLDEERNNYVTTQGGGNLHLTYTGESGLNVTGRYTMSGGDFKISLPVIPLKTLQISDGSNVSWSGRLLDPELDITALERVTSSVTLEDNNLVPVPFDVGVKVSNTLDKMGLSFVMSSPENPTIQEQLNALDTEMMNRYAVTMLVTGAYAGSSKSMSVSNALNSFIDAKINDIAGTAMKSVSVNVGINDATNAETGSTYKNYSFSFSKRFWNDRMTLVIGGEVNSGEHRTSNNSFINNASLEWKISENSNRFLKLFYDKNYQSILEGEIIETGIGYVYKRKLGHLKELFIFNRKRDDNKEYRIPASLEKRDSINVTTDKQRE